MFPEIWYHGSPYCCLKNATDFQGKVMFVTDSKRIAQEYTKVLPASGKIPTDDFTLKPTIYEINLNFDKNKIFDTRRDDHLKLFFELAKESRKLDPDEGFRKSDLLNVYPAPGSNISGEFPSYGIVYTLMPMLKERGFIASFIGEGTQGASLAILNPKSNITINKMYENPLNKTEKYALYSGAAILIYFFLRSISGK